MARSPKNIINFSEAATLARCETQWAYAFLLNENEPGEKKGLHKGTLLHVGADQWLRGYGVQLPESWNDDINTGGKPGERRVVFLSDFDPEIVDDAQWLLDRYAAHYGERPPSDWEIVSSEEWLTAIVRVGKQVFRLVGRTDGIIRINGGLWLREVKSAANIFARLKSVNVEPQPGIYYELVKAKYGEYPMGILYDGIHTYRWKSEKPTLASLVQRMKDEGRTESTKDLQAAAKIVQARHPGVERPPAASFERAWPDRSPEQVAANMAQLALAIRRRSRIKSLDDTLPNIGMSCNSCGFQPRCWARLVGDDESEIEVEDDGREIEWE